MKNTFNGTLEEVDVNNKKIKVDDKWYQCIEIAFEYVTYYEIGCPVQLTFTEEDSSKVGMVAKRTVAKIPPSVEKSTPTDKPTEKKKYVGVTIGMAINNATHLCIAEKKYSAQEVVLKAKDLLLAMEDEELL